MKVNDIPRDINGRTFTEGMQEYFEKQNLTSPCVTTSNDEILIGVYSYINKNKNCGKYVFCNTSYADGIAYDEHINVIKEFDNSRDALEYFKKCEQNAIKNGAKELAKSYRGRNDYPDR